MKRNHLSFSYPYSWNITPHIKKMILESCPKITGMGRIPRIPGESQWRLEPPLTAACFTFLLRIFCPRPPDSRVGTPSRGSSQQHPQLCRICLVWAPNHRWLVFCWWDGNPWIKGTSTIFENKTSHNLCVFQTAKRDIHKIPRMDIGFTKKNGTNCTNRKVRCPELPPKKKDLHTKHGILESQPFWGRNSLGWRVEAQSSLGLHQHTSRPGIVRNFNTTQRYI